LFKNEAAKKAIASKMLGSGHGDNYEKIYSNINFGGGKGLIMLIKTKKKR